MRTTPLLFCSLVAALFAAGVVTAQAADGRFYDPSNAASPTGYTTGYKLYRTIGCPGRELFGTPCLVTEPVAAAPVSPSSAVTPTPPATIVAVEPVRVVVPIPARTEQYCAILDIQFEIDQDDIQREEKEKFAVLGTFLTKYPDSTVLIEGHTDNVGTSEYNMALSQRRADSVVSYLVDNLHIAPARLTAVGYGARTKASIAAASRQGRCPRRSSTA